MFHSLHRAVAALVLVSSLMWLTAAESGWKNEVSIKVEGDRRVIIANGIPDHATGQFPGRGNPNRIAPQSHRFTMPAHPVAARGVTKLGMYPFGVAVNGVVFDPAAAEWWRGDPASGWQYEPLSGAIDLGTDDSNAHVQPNGAYHYHGVPVALLKRLTGGGDAMVLLGWAADGFPIYNAMGHQDPKDAASPLVELKPGYRVKKGQRPDGPGGEFDGSFVADYEWVAGAGDLDECNGRSGVTPEFPEGTYYYVVTAAFPYVPRLFRGTPDASFFRNGPQGGGKGRPPRMGRRGGPGFGPPGGGFPPPPGRVLPPPPRGGE